MQKHKQKRPKFIISGGGTGGHIFPAIAIANALKEKRPEAEFLFVGAKGKMEMEKVPAAGYAIEGLWISGLQRKLTTKNLLFPFKVVSSLIRARQIVRHFKPDVVIGVGGYASGPMLKAATALGVPALIQEQNSFPGITNKMLASAVSKICVAYDDMEQFFPSEKIIKTGNPIRRNVIEIEGKKNEAARFFEFNPAIKTLLIVGGSQGALSVNYSIKVNIEKFKSSEIQILWQTGKYFFSEAQQLVQAIEAKNIRVTAFIEKMDLAYALADVIISRAGAIAISEICAIGKPTIFIPLPSATEDHQTKNALALVNKNAAILIEDKNAVTEIAGKVLGLFADDSKQKELSVNIKKLAITNSADLIADEILKLIK